MKTDQNSKRIFKNTRGGFRQCVSVGSGGTGHRGDKVVADDNLSVAQARSDAERSTANFWWEKTMTTRLNDRRRGAKVFIGQRLHEDDTAGRAIKSGLYDALVLPSEFLQGKRCKTSICWEDPRTDDGELLFPQLFPAEVIESDKITLGSADYSAQHQQDPTPATGDIFKIHWWRYWKPAGLDLPPVEILTQAGPIFVEAVDLPSSFDQVVQSWDMTFKDTEGSDFVAGGVIGRKGANAYVLDCRNEKLSFTKSCDAVIAMSARWPQSTAKYVEDKANGPAVISSLRARIPGLIEVNPEGGKVARAQAVSPAVEAGNVFLPHPAVHGWVDGMRDQLTKFPRATHDDMVDMLTQALLKLLVRQHGHWDW